MGFLPLYCWNAHLLMVLIGPLIKPAVVHVSGLVNLPEMYVTVLISKGVVPETALLRGFVLEAGVIRVSHDFLALGIFGPLPAPSVLICGREVHGTLRIRKRPGVLQFEGRRQVDRRVRFAASSLSLAPNGY
jgi:hypothetical protein